MSHEDFQLPEFWATYSDIEPLVRALLMEPDRAAKDGQRLSDFVAAVGERGMHGAVAAVALTWGALDDLAGVLGVRTATTISLVSRVVPWRVPAGRDHQRDPRVLGCRRASSRRCGCARGIITDHGDVLARGLAERLVFAVETAALLSRRSPEEQAEVFLERFFTVVR